MAGLRFQEAIVGVSQGIGLSEVLQYTHIFRFSLRADTSSIGTRDISCDTRIWIWTRSRGGAPFGPQPDASNNIPITDDRYSTIYGKLHLQCPLSPALCCCGRGIYLVDSVQQ